MWLWLVQRKRMAQFDPRYENMCGVGLTAALVNPTSFIEQNSGFVLTLDFIIAFWAYLEP